MEALLEPLLNNPLLALFVIVGLGLLLGNLEIRGIGLGASGVIFVALFAGHLGLTVPPDAGRIGLALFVYAVGIGAGSRFFRSLQREGSQLARLALVIVGSGALCTYGLAQWAGLDLAMATGLFAGALTSTPALAAALEGAGPARDAVVVGYGIAYPFGVIGVVLFVQLLPKLLGKSLEEGREAEEAADLKVVRQLVEVTNPSLDGRLLVETALGEVGACQVSRIWRGDRLQPVQYDDRLHLGQLVMLVGEVQAVKLATELAGRASDHPVVLNADDERQNFVVTQRSIFGKTVAELNLLREHGVVITRISRMDFTFTPRATTRLEPNDILTVVGSPAYLKQFQSVIGERAQSFNETSLISLAVGLALGILLGMIPFPLPGGNSFSLGLAGGPLMVALLLGHFGKIGGVIGHIPRPTRLLLQEMGLVFFLADAGVKGGATMVEAVAAQGAQVFGVGALVTIIPMVLGYVLARWVFKMPLAQTLGAICGGMTSTPALGAITAKTTRQAPVVSYATVYPVAVILMAILAKILVQLQL